jgi:hypothetical protein
MAKTEAPEDPIVAIYPVPGEIDEREKDRLPPVPTRLERDRAKKAVATGAFSYEDATQTDESKAERAPATTATKAEIAKAVKAAEDEAAKTVAERDAEIAALKAELAAAKK